MPISRRPMRCVEPGADDRVDERHPHHVAGNLDAEEGARPEIAHRMTMKEISVTTAASSPSASVSVRSTNMFRSSAMRWSGLSVPLSSSCSR